MSHTRTLRRLTALAAVTILPLAGSLNIALAQSADQASFELRPFCPELEKEAGNSAPPDMMGSFAGDLPDIPGIINPDDAGGNMMGAPDNCPKFEVQSPSMKKTQKLKVGDVLDMHLVLNNPAGLSISRLRSWLVYDPSVLRGDELILSNALPILTPGEAEFSATEGYAKIGASAAAGLEPKSNPIVVAHLKFTVIATPYTSTVISFYDAQGTEEGHTYSIRSDTQVDMLASTLPSIFVELDQTAVEPPVATSSMPSSAASVASIPEAVTSVASSNSSSSSMMSESSSAISGTSSISSAQASVAPPLPSPTFSLLQPQNLRVTTEESAAYLAWDPLPSAELVGYNIYYGTVSGNYLQKRSIDRSATNLTLRGLPEGQTYFFALRGANGAGEETQFGQEAAVTIGNPSTSTAPLSASVFTTPGPQGVPPATGGQIGGETGLPSALVLFIVVSASVGTMLAFRRQWTASAHISA